MLPIDKGVLPLGCHWPVQLARVIAAHYGALQSQQEGQEGVAQEHQYQGCESRSCLMTAGEEPCAVCWLLLSHLAPHIHRWSKRQRTERGRSARLAQWTLWPTASSFLLTRCGGLPSSTSVLEKHAWNCVCAVLKFNKEKDLLLKTCTKTEKQTRAQPSAQRLQGPCLAYQARHRIPAVLQSRDNAGAAAVASGAKRRRQREHKPLRYDVVAAASKVRPVLRPPTPKRRAVAKAAAAGPSSAAAGQAGGLADGAAHDLWAEEPAKQSAADADFAEAAQLAVQALRRGAEDGMLPRAAKRRCNLSARDLFAECACARHRAHHTHCLCYE